jgi:drug/metabolite transporter (DMT)-like permease
MVPVLSAIVSIITRQLKHLRAGLLVLWFGLGALAVSAGGLVVSGSFDFSPYASDWQLDVSILGVVLLGMAGNVLYTLAMRWVSPSKGNVFRSFEVILNCALQVALDHVPFYWLTGIGICLLLVAVVATGFESDVMARFGGRRRWRFL